MTRLRTPLATLPFRARRASATTRVGTERWMVSYADLVTLLFVFFVVLYAVSRADPEVLGRFTRSMQLGFQAKKTRPARLPAGTAQATLQERLAAAGLGSTVPARADERGITLTLPTDAFFHSGTATLRPETLPLLEEVGRFLATLEGTIVVEGHADDQPTGSTVYATPWELSAARAARVVRHLAETCALEPTRLSAVGLGSSRPLHAGAEGDALGANGRIEILVAR